MAMCIIVVGTGSYGVGRPWQLYNLPQHSSSCSGSAGAVDVCVDLMKRTAD